LPLPFCCRTCRSCCRTCPFVVAPAVLVVAFAVLVGVFALLVVVFGLLVVIPEGDLLSPLHLLLSVLQSPSPSGIKNLSSPNTTKTRANPENSRGVLVMPGPL
jgi:hypothetical protein